jgi:ribosome recycling factor
MRLCVLYYFSFHRITKQVLLLPMTDSIEILLTTAEEKMKKALVATGAEMGTIRTGRANPMMLDRVMVDYYGTLTPVRQMTNVSIVDGQTIVIQPYDKGQIPDIERAISKAPDLGLTPNNDGSVIRLTVPPLTEQRRKEMVKLASKYGQDGMVAIRNIRRDAGTDLDKAKKDDHLPEDDEKRIKDKIQKLTDKYIDRIESMVKDKSKELLEV